MTQKIYIDGEHGTTGLALKTLLECDPQIQVIPIPYMLRKDVEARLACAQNADLVVLCLPDEEAKESVARLTTQLSKPVKLLDASSAHRVHPEWVYGFPELEPQQASKIRTAKRVSNPGCYATAAIALLRPLCSLNVLPEQYPLTINAVSGYSGGGASLIRIYEELHKGKDFALYGLNFKHKHLPEIVQYSLLKNDPLFIPSVADYYQGMIVSIPLYLNALSMQLSGEDLLKIYQDYYQDYPNITVEGQEDKIDDYGFKTYKNSLSLNICVYWNSIKRQALLVCMLDNLGKGAAGAAVLNCRLMLGLA